MNDLFGFGGVALGGALAAVVAFWGQAKSLFRQLSSVLILQVSFNTSIHNALVSYLKDNWKRVPSGILNIRGVWTDFVDRTEHLVPFLVLSSTTIWYSRHGLVIFTRSDTGGTLISIRGLCDVRRLICSAVSEFEKEISDHQGKSNRFFVSTLVGCEKGPWAARANKPESQVTSGVAPATETSAPDVDMKRDTSLMYTRSQYLVQNVVNPLEGLFYDQEILNYLEEAKTWKASQRWYQERSIPWKRGWLIYGPGGTGKSSFAQVVAKTLNVPLYNFVLSTMSDQEFISLMQDRLSPPCVVLFEDFDTVFDKREPLTEHKSLTFDCVLNQISGVKTLNGVFLIVTTNHIGKIDEALGVSSEFGSISTRPGRIDQVIYLGESSEGVRCSIARSILKDWPDEVPSVVENGKGMTAVQFQEMCLQRAFARINARHD